MGRGSGLSDRVLRQGGGRRWIGRERHRFWLILRLLRTRTTRRSSLETRARNLAGIRSLRPRVLGRGGVAGYRYIRALSSG